ncbi:MAG: hypothetical protein KG075_20075 [Alphaproteobacteria bacterium]|nr:hypothetical protein [Alphaproteobacteria bacterium]
MTARATRLASVPELTTLVVVFPDLAMLPCGMGNCVAGFHRVIVVSNTTREFLGSPLAGSRPTGTAFC